MTFLIEKVDRVTQRMVALSPFGKLCHLHTGGGADYRTIKVTASINLIPLKHGLPPFDSHTYTII